jgi:hypothetical protein
MRAVVLDTNLLVLWVVGSLDRRLISTHKRTRKFTPQDFATLAGFLSSYPRIIVTPNVVTETSNLLRQTDDATGRRLLGLLKQVLARLEERFVPSTDAASVPGFLFLGVADSATLHRPPPDSVLLTDDLPLYLQASRLGHSAVNFTHLQAQNLLS